MLQRYNEYQIQLVIDQYSDMVYKLCLVYLKRAHDAEDALQEIFIKIIEKAPYFNNKEHEKAWIITVTCNHCKNILKHKRNKYEIEFDESHISYIENNDDKEILQLIFTLPLNYRNVLYLYYYEGYSTKEISSMLKTKDATVRTWLKRARENMKVLIGGGYDE